MDEQEGQAAVAEAGVVETTTATAGTEAPVDFVNGEGVFVEDWQSKLQDESLRGDKTLKTLKNVESLAKSYVHVRKQVPLDKIAIPGVNATEDELSAFHEALGRPKTVDDYNYQAPDDIDIADLSPESVKESLNLIHQAGYSQKQFDIGKQILQDTLRGIQKATDDFEERDKSEAETALRNKWGTAYDENLHLVNRMISENSEAGEEMDYLIAEYGNNPRLAGFLGNIAKKFIEHRIITDIETPSADTESKIAELMNTPAYKDPNFPDRAEHKRVVAQVYALREQLVAMQKTG